MRKCDVGGQAIIEGVMMRGSKGVATAVRTPNGKIEVKVKKTKPITKRYRVLNIPVIRGAAILIDSLIVGIPRNNPAAIKSEIIIVIVTIKSFAPLSPNLLLSQRSNFDSSSSSSKKLAE